MEIKVAMVRAGVSGRELARRLNTSQTWISTRLNGVTPLDLDDLERIARIIEVPAVELLRRAAGPDSLNPALTHLDLEALTTSPATPFSRAASRPSGPTRRDRVRPVSAIPANRRRPGWVKSRSSAA